MRARDAPGSRPGNVRTRLAAALSSAGTSGEVATAAVDLVADLLGAAAASIVLCADDGLHVAAVSRHTVDEHLQELLGTRWTRVPDGITMPAARAVAEGRPVLLDRPADGSDGSRRFSARAVDAYPVRTSEGVVAALTLVFVGSHPDHAEHRASVRAVLEELGRTLERARSHEREHAIAASLQRSLLPRSLPELDHADLGVAFRPGSTDADVGSNWFEALVLDDELLLLAVGDVSGRGLAAAPAMADIRQSLRAYAALTSDPVRLVEMLAEYHRQHPAADGSGLTVVVTVFDPTSCDLSWVNAGQQPPLLVRGSGVTVLEGARGPAIGAGSGWTSEQIELQPDDVLVLHTEGLLVRDDRSREAARDGLMRTLSELGDLPAPRICDQVVAGLDTEHTLDDATVVALRVPTEDWATSWRLPARPRSVGLARRLTRRQLHRLGVFDPEVVATAELLVSELVSNVIKHTQSRPSLLVTRVDRVVRLEVGDENAEDLPEPRPFDVQSEHGRGLLLVDALSSAWGVDPGPAGKRIWVEIDTRAGSRPASSTTSV